MTDLDTATLRRALKATGDTVDQVDVTQIMTRGRRLRRRRRLTVVAGGVCAVAIFAGTGTVIAQLTAAPPARSQPMGPAVWPGQQRPAHGRPTQHGPGQPTPSPSSTSPASPGTASTSPASPSTASSGPASGKPPAVSPTRAPSASPTRTSGLPSMNATPTPYRGPSSSPTPTAVPRP